MLLVYSAVVALNSGVMFGYDAESKLWRLMPPSAELLPGSVAGSGGLFFAGALLVLALYPAVVHSLNTRQSVYFAITATVVVVIDAAFAAGANTLDGISFSAEDTSAAKTESLNKAVAEAKAKAETLAAASGLSVTGIAAINEGGTYSYANTSGNFAADTVEADAKEYSGSTVVQAAKVIVNATVNVTFEAE